MTDLTQPASAAEFMAAGADPATAANLATQHNIMTGRAGPDARAALNFEMRDAMPAPPTSPPPVLPTSAAAAMEALNAHTEAQLGNHMASLYEPPAQPWDYRIPAVDGDLAPEAMAADRAFVQTLHAERMPLDIGNAILQDLHSARPTPKSAETVAALTPMVQQMLTKAQADPALKQFAAGLSPNLLIQALSPETVVAMLPWVKFRAGKT